MMMQTKKLFGALGLALTVFGAPSAQAVNPDIRTLIGMEGYYQITSSGEIYLYPTEGGMAGMGGMSGMHGMGGMSGMQGMGGMSGMQGMGGMSGMQGMGGMSGMQGMGGMSGMQGMGGMSGMSGMQGMAADQPWWKFWR
jgi:hypothetical protein